MKFRPCIDLHDGKVKQIVGSTLNDNGNVVENFVSEYTPAYFADMYHKDGLRGGHVIMLGKGNELAAKEALGAHPGYLQVGGGITPENAKEWMDAGAEKLIVTSWLFPDGELDFDRVEKISSFIGKENLVIDLSCVKYEDNYHVACNRWQKICKFSLSKENLAKLEKFCAEYLVHAVNVEGKCGGIDSELVQLLADWTNIPVTYAGGIRNLDDIRELNNCGKGKIDFTVGSALDIFGGKLKYKDVVLLKL